MFITLFFDLFLCFRDLTTRRRLLEDEKPKVCNISRWHAFKWFGEKHKLWIFQKNLNPLMLRNLWQCWYLVFKKSKIEVCIIFHIWYGKSTSILGNCWNFDLILSNLLMKYPRIFTAGSTHQYLYVFVEQCKVYIYWPV